MQKKSKPPKQLNLDTKTTPKQSYLDTKTTLKQSNLDIKTTHDQSQNLTPRPITLKFSDTKKILNFWRSPPQPLFTSEYIFRNDARRVKSSLNLASPLSLLDITLFNICHFFPNLSPFIC